MYLFVTYFVFVCNLVLGFEYDLHYLYCLDYTKYRNCMNEYKS